VARSLNEARLATLLFDLLLEREASDRRLVFDIGLLAGRLVQAVDWATGPHGPPGSGDVPRTGLPVGLFGASTGAAAALEAAARRPLVRAVVSRGGRPDLAVHVLRKVFAPTLLIVGEHDVDVLEMNRRALGLLAGIRELAVVPAATHLFEEPGALEQVAQLSTRWFVAHLCPEARP
jgi:putative phosphoribosyl transferase